MANRCRYCYTPAAGRPWMRQTIFDRALRWLRKKTKSNSDDYQKINYYSGYNSPVYPDGWVIR